jgi:4a-hydroxytetrahydrobiopterin dehydratase
MSSDLARKACVPCRGGVPPLAGRELADLQAALGGGWRTVDEHHLEKEFGFEDFRSALDFTNRVGELAEEQGHHPDIYLSWGRVRIQIWTHKIDGLTESDLVLAAKIDEL